MTKKNIEMELKKGSKGKDVELLQRHLNLKIDGDFGVKTEVAVMRFQIENGLVADGVVGRKTWEKLGIASSDVTESMVGLGYLGRDIETSFMDKNEYVNQITKKEFVFLHHTAGWDNPYNTIKGWNDDDRGRIGTEFVIGGQSIKGDDKRFDGKILQAFPKGNWAYHLGTIGKEFVHSGSVGIELCNFGQLSEDGFAWQGTRAHVSQICELDAKFRGFKFFHKYSDEQLISCKALILYIAERDNIDVRDGLVKQINKIGVKAFEYNEDAFYGRIKGLWTHTNTRKDKMDCSPQEGLVDMLKSL